MDKWDRHCGDTIQIKLKNKEGTEDAFDLKPLDVTYMVKFMKIMSSMQNKDFDFDEETTQHLVDIIMAILKNSYPEVAEEKLKNFAMANFMLLVTKIMELHSFGQDMVDDNTKKQIEEMQKKYLKK